MRLGDRHIVSGFGFPFGCKTRVDLLVEFARRIIADIEKLNRLGPGHRRRAGSSGERDDSGGKTNQIPAHDRSPENAPLKTRVRAKDDGLKPFRSRFSLPRTLTVKLRATRIRDFPSAGFREPRGGRISRGPESTTRRSLRRPESCHPERKDPRWVPGLFGVPMDGFRDIWE